MSADHKNNMTREHIPVKVVLTVILTKLKPVFSVQIVDLRPFIEFVSVISQVTRKINNAD